MTTRWCGPASVPFCTQLIRLYNSFYSGVMSTHFYVSACLIGAIHYFTFHSFGKWRKLQYVRWNLKHEADISVALSLFTNEITDCGTVIMLWVLQEPEYCRSLLSYCAPTPTRSHFHCVFWNIHFNYTILSHNPTENTNTNVRIILLNKTNLAHMNKWLPECHS